MSDFNFYNFLESNGYTREKIRKQNGQFFCNIYQKEISENVHNSICIHENKTMSVASEKYGLFVKEQPQPTTEEEAKILIKKAEEI